MKIVALMLIAGMSVYAQRGHAGGGRPGMGGGMGHAENAPLGGNSMAGAHGTSSVADRPSSQTVKPSQQSPETILQRNTQLSSKLDSLLPAGMTAQEACSGFKNLGGCVAAIHVAHNLGIPFEDLKDKMTSSTPEKLGTAIHSLKPDVNAKAEAKKAQKQANADIEESTKS